MREACIRATESAMGRTLTVAESRDIEARVTNAMTRAARADIAKWRAMPRDQQLLEGGKLAAQELQAESAKKKQRLGEAIMLQAWNEKYLSDQVIAGHDKTKLDALQRLLAARYDDKDNALSVEAMANGHFNAAMGEVMEVFEAIRPGLWHWLPWQNKDIQTQFRFALAHQTHYVDAKGERQPIDKTFIDAAKAYHDTIEAQRQMFNAAGGVVGRLENYDQPHSWSRRLVNKYGQDEYVNDMMGWVDRSRYGDLGGRPFTDGDMRDFLAEAWLTKASDGWSKDRDQTVPGGRGMKANRNSAHRSIHLKPEFVDAALSKYSEKSVAQAVVDHLRQMSRDIALVQRFGPNADLQFRQLMDDALQEEMRSLPGKSFAERNALPGSLHGKAAYLQALYDHLAGNEPLPASQGLADFAGTYRSLKSSAALGSAIITSLTDFATLYKTAAANKLNPVKVALNSALIWAPRSRKYVKRMGLMVEAVTGFANRFGYENLTARDLSDRVASAVIGASGLNFVTDARRLGFAMTMMDAVGDLTRRIKDVTKLAENDRTILASKGIDQRTWDIWRAAKLEAWGVNGKLLTPDAIMAIADPQYTDIDKRRAVAAMLGLVQEERDMAIIQPGARERTQMRFGTRPGTPLGEFARTGLLFKSFPWTFFQRHMERGTSQPGLHKKLWYLGSLAFMMTLLGATAQEIADLIQGKNPRSLNPNNEFGGRNLATGFMKGGALGIYGDFLFSELSPYSNTSLAETLAGPMVSDISKVGQIGTQVIKGATEDDEEQFQKAGANTVKAIRGITPGSNLWYTRAAMDRYFWNTMVEGIDPDYFSELEDRQESQQGTTYWWANDAQAGFDGSQIEAPDLSEAVAE